MNTFNVIAIGGTGMRCAESLVYLCAMGMFDDTVVNLLALDTDQANGNFQRLQNLIGNYNRITSDRDEVASNTLFSAKINYFTFSPDYKEGTDYDDVARYTDANSKIHDDDGVKWKESDIAELFLTPEMRSMDLQHGYRAQTQMGSMLMYHAIKEEAYKVKYGDNSNNNNTLTKFIDILMEGDQTVFLFGSVFGGTGASSIPILPRALNEAAKILSKDGHGDVLSNNYFGTVMLTNYFSFEAPGKNNEVVATSDKFALNSQAALSFYLEDSTVQATYKRLYLLGRENMRNITGENCMSTTGGKFQKNPVDYMELAAASAAYDFFKSAKANKFGSEAEVYYRSMAPDERDCLTFESFFGADKDKFTQKCGIMMASAFLFGPQNFAEDRRKQESFNTLTPKSVEDIRYFFRSFYNLDEDNLMENGAGWIKEMQESAKQTYKGFLFNEAAYSTTPKSAVKFNYNNKLFPEGSSYRYDVGWTSSAYSTFRDSFGKRVKLSDTSDKKVVSKLLRLTYETFTELYAFPVTSSSL